MPTHSKRFLVAISICILGLAACNHPLQVKNLGLYAAPLRLSSFERPPKVAILPYHGGPDGLFYFNVLVDRINQSPLVSTVETEYIPRAAGAGGFQPDLIFSIKTTASYRSSLWNFPNIFILPATSFSSLSSTLCLGSRFN